MRDLLQASHKAGYKIGVDSPETMEGVEGLTHDHLMELENDVYMKFNHAYVVGGCNESKIQLLDPHGDNIMKDQQTYSPLLNDNMKELRDLLKSLKLEMEESNYSSFSVKTKQALDKVFANLEVYKQGKTVLHLLSKKWNYINNRKELIEQDGAMTGLRSKVGKNVLEELLKNETVLLEEDLGKGFTLTETPVPSKQSIAYNLLTENFQAIRIHQIK
ncbi:MAG: hypothetical protein AB8E82_02655 [Aureispira sp.]